MAKYLSNRQKNLKVGIASYTENKTVLEVTGNVGIGTTNATSDLFVVGDGYFTGILTANRIFSNLYGEFTGSISAGGIVGAALSISGISTLGVTSTTVLTAEQLNVIGITTLGSNGSITTTGGNLYVGGNLEVAGSSNFIGTATFRGGTIGIGDSTSDDINIGGEFVSNLVPKYDNTYDIGTESNKWRNASFSGLTTTNDLYVSGISTLGVTSATQLTSQSLTVSGNSNFGITEILVNSSSDALKITQTGSGNALLVQDESNPDSSPFVVTGVGSVGVGILNPLEKLHIDGNLRLGASDSNYIAFKGTTGDIFNGGFNHTFIGERIYTPGTEESELLLFKGNDHDLSIEGPDRIRLAAAEIRFDTYTIPTSGSFEEVATSGNLNTRFVIRDHGFVGIGTADPSATLDVYGNLNVSGISTINTLDATIVDIENLTTTNINSSGISTLGIATINHLYVSGLSTFVGVGTFNSNLYVGGDVRISGILTVGGNSVVIDGDNDLIKIGSGVTLGALSGSIVNLSGTDLNYSGIGTIGTLDTNTGTIDYLSGTDLNYTGVGTIGTLNVTNSTINYLSGIDLNYTGIGTFGTLAVTGLTTTKDLRVVGITTLGVTTVTNLTAQSINSSGLVTATSFVPTSGYIKAPDGTNSFYIYSGTGNVSFQGTIGASQINNASGYKAIDFISPSSAPTVRIANNLSVSGFSSASSFISTSTSLQAPTVGNYVGERLRLYDFKDPSNTNYAIGVEGSHIWFGVDTNNDAQGFKWYGETTQVMRLGASGNLTLEGNLRLNGNTIQSSNGATAITLSDNDVTIADRLTVNGTSTFTGTITGTISTATKLETARNFSIGGDFVTAPSISFNGTDNVAFAATITENSIGLGTYTSGDYVKNISGTSNQITVTGGTGEGSTPTLSIPSQFTAPQDVTVTRDLQVNRNLNVTGNITIGGTTAFINVQEIKVYDPDIVLGVRTDGSGNDISTDNTANHGGIAVASTEGNPLVQIYNPGIGESTPATYKKIMWFKGNTLGTGTTDAWLFNYAVGIGSTQVPNGVRLAAGSVQFTENDLAVVRNINASGIVTASSFVGALTGTATTATTLTKTITAGSGLSGGGELTADRTIDVNVGTGITITSDAVVLKNGDNLTDNRLVKWDDTNNQLTDTIITDTGTNIGIGSTQPTSKLQVVGDIAINSTTVTGSATSSLSSLSPTSIHTGLSTSTYRFVEYTIQATQSTNYQCTKILALHNGTTAYHTEYGTVYNNTAIASFDVDISGGNIRLLATGSSPSSTDYVINFIATKI